MARSSAFIMMDVKTPFTHPLLHRPPHYAHAVSITDGSLIFTAGSVPLNAAGELVGVGDLTAQTNQVIDNLEAVLQAHSAGFDDVVKFTVFVVSAQPRDLATVWDVVTSAGLATSSTGATLLGVTALGYEGQLVEIELVASR